MSVCQSASGCHTKRVKQLNALQITILHRNTKLAAKAESWEIWLLVDFCGYYAIL